VGFRHDQLFFVFLFLLWCLTQVFFSPWIESFPPAEVIPRFFLRALVRKRPPLVVRRDLLGVPSLTKAVLFVPFPTGIDSGGFRSPTIFTFFSLGPANRSVEMWARFFFFRFDQSSFTFFFYRPSTTRSPHQGSPPSLVLPSGRLHLLICFHFCLYMLSMVRPLCLRTLLGKSVPPFCWVTRALRPQTPRWLPPLLVFSVETGTASRSPQFFLVKACGNSYFALGHSQTVCLSDPPAHRGDLLLAAPHTTLLALCLAVCCSCGSCGTSRAFGTALSPTPRFSYGRVSRRVETSSGFWC